MGWYKTASKEDHWAKMNQLEEAARNEYISSHPKLSQNEIDEIKHGHGIYKGSCGHTISQCRCAHGGNFVYKLPVECEECKQ